MGTRNLTCVYKDDDFKVAQYGQWDGYPEGNGLVILNYLRDHQDDLCDAVDRCEWLDEEWPPLSRDTGADILPMIVQLPGAHELINSASFAHDSLYCEWAYVVNFDTNELEVYRGFNEVGVKIDPGVFADVPDNHDESDGTGITKVASFMLDHLPSDEQFLATLSDEGATE